MKTLLDLICKYSHAISLRAECWRELRRLRRREGVRVPMAGWDILMQPARVDDAILMRRFVQASNSILIVDVGGNTGEWAEKMFRFMPKAKVIAFEPDANVCETYKRRFAGDGRAVVYNVGLSESASDSVLHVATDSRHSSLGKLSSDREVASIPVRLERLDAYKAEISAAMEATDFSILKIDVQGHELQVLKGATELIGQFDLIYLECSIVTTENKQDVPTFAVACREMLAHGFYPVLLRDYSRQFGPYAIERDVIFVKDPLARCIIGY